MTAAELLDFLVKKGVELWVEGERLRYRAPAGVLTPELRDELRQHKQELLSLVSGVAAPQPGAVDTDGCSLLSFGQQSLWFLYHTAPHSPAYNLASVQRIRSDIDIPTLHRTFQTLVKRHPSLRTTYFMRSGQPMQRVHEHREVRFQQIDASSWEWGQLVEEVEREYRQPLDLERGPIVRVRLFTRSVDDHVLIVTMHHISCDGWALWMIQDELGKLYAGERAGKPVELPPLTATYVDYVRWQAGMLAGPSGDTLWRYWKERLGGELPVLDLPADRPRPAVQTDHGASLHFEVGADAAERLRRRARDEGCTLYMLLAAAFHVLLHRYSGQTDILVGGPTFGRSRPEFAQVVGHFVNPVVLRSDFSSNPTFRSFLGQIRQRALEVLAHQDFPFSLLVERLNPKRDLSRSPLYQVAFLLQKPDQFHKAAAQMASRGRAVQIDWGGLKIEPFPMVQEEGQHDLTLELFDGSASLPGSFKYNTDLFDETTIMRMRDHYLRLLDAFVVDPDRRVSDLPLLTDTERAWLLVAPNAADADFPREANFPHLFERQAERTPDALAAVCGDSKLSYRELNERSNQLAHTLRGLNVGPETLVAICVERSVDMLAGILGIMKAGGAYLPLDPAYPDTRLQFMLQDSQAAVLVVHGPTASRFPRPATRVVCLDGDARQISANSRVNPVCAAGATNLAYVIYTSGSTGRPKGVALEHRGLCHLAIALQDAFYISAGDRVLQFSSLSFDASVAEISSALSAGAALCLARQEELLPGPGLIALLRRQAISVVTLPPSVLAATSAEALPDLHTLVSAGEACTADIVGRWGVGRRLVNGFGPTEVTVCATAGRCETESGRPSIGRPLPGKQVYVLDAHMQPVPIGVTGELYIGGVGLARCYLNRPDLTAERFVANPFTGQPGARLYKTGDLCAWRADGNLDFRGRIDHQVKIRAFRIELGEVETALTAHPGVRQAVAIAREDVPGEPRLVAYVVPEGEPHPSVTELRSFLKTTLPDFMVPAAFIFLDTLPLSPNGKVDRKALPAPERLRPNLDRPYVAPRTEAERVLAEIWAEVLGVEKVGVHDNYFELGGASVNSLRIVARASEASLSINSELLKPELLFEHPTVAELAELVSISREPAERKARESVLGEGPPTPQPLDRRPPGP